MIRGNRQVTAAAWTLLAWTGGALVFFRAQWTSGFRRLMGNDGDTRLIAYLCEHWFRVFHGQASALNPSFFYPVRGLLGWSDGFLLYEVFYTPLRLLGLDPFLALQVTVILLSLLGFTSLVLLLRLAFGTPLPAALLCATMFTFSNALWLHVGSVQLSGIYLVPPILLVGLLAGRAATAGRRRQGAVLGAGFGLLAAMMFFTAYYVAWFSALAVTVVVAAILLAGRGRSVTLIAGALRRRAAPLAAGSSAFVVGLIPVLAVYLPARHRAGGSSYAQVLDYAARPHDYANVGAGNLLWSGPVHRLAPSISFSTYEKTYAVTPIVALLALGGGAWCAWRLWRGRAALPPVAAAAAVFSFAAVVLMLVPLHSELFTPWALLRHLPGASAMRAIDRAQIVVALLAVLAIAAAITEMAHDAVVTRRSAVRIAGLAVLALACVEQLNTTGESALNHSYQVALLRSITAPPPGCHSFYAVDASNQSLPFYELQIDAMLVSQRDRVPTLNGYTGYNPSGWGLEQLGSAYPTEVYNWAELNGIQSGVCQLDLGTMHWVPPVVTAKIATDG